MTQSPHFDAPGQPPPPGYAPVGPPPWSGVSIAAFVSSLLGCTILGGLLGFILGIVGIFDAKGGRRRGIGLAIAAIPISLLTGVTASLLLAAALALASSIGDLPEQLHAAWSEAGGDPAKTAAALQAIVTDDFKGAVPEAKLVEWCAKIRGKHGNPTAIELSKATPASGGPGGALRFHLDAKFVNGPASMTLVLKKEKDRMLKIDDIDIDGSSPRDKD